MKEKVMSIGDLLAYLDAFKMNETRDDVFTSIGSLATFKDCDKLVSRIIKYQKEGADSTCNEVLIARAYRELTEEGEDISIFEVLTVVGFNDFEKGRAAEREKPSSQGLDSLIDMLENLKSKPPEDE